MSTNTITVTSSSTISVVTIGTQGLELTGSAGGIAIYDSTNSQWIDSASTRAQSLTAKLYNLQFTAGGATVTGVLDEDNLNSNSAVKLATQQSIKAYVDAQVTAQDLDLTDGSTTIAIDLDSETLSILGGTGITSAASGNGVTISITTEDVQDLVGAMFSSNTESGIAVTYQDADGTIDLNVDDFSITLTGDVTGSGTVTNLGDVSFATTITANSLVLGTDTTGNYVATIAAGEGIDVSGSGSETAAITISAEDATSSNKGIASFASADFVLSSGAVTVKPAQTTITSITNAALVVGRDADNDIDFATDDTVIFRAAGADQVKLIDGVLAPVTDNDVDLGTASLQFKDAYINGTLEADAITIAGITLAETISDTVGAMVSNNTETNITVTYQDDDNTLDFVIGTLNQDTTGTAQLATTVTVSANNSTDETVYPVFVDGATGAQGAETDTGLNYNPSSGMLTSAGFTGALTGNASTATLLESARTIGGVSFNGSAAIVPATITVADTNDATSFVGLFESATGDLAPKTDAALLYNASNGTLTSTIITATTAFVPDASDGASLGTSALEFSDLYLADGAVVNFGDDQEVTLTHVHDTGLLLNGAMQLQFNDASQFIQAPDATTLDINATAEVEINATLLDVNANINASGTYVGAGLMTTGGNIVIPDAGYIGSASDTDAIQIEADGDIVLSQDLAVTGTLGVTGVATLASHLELGDNDQIKVGAAADMLLYHDATNSYLTNKTGVMKIATETSGIAVQIGHGTSETTFGDNVTITGDLTINGATTTVATTNLTVTDPLVKYAQAYTGTAYDSGIIITRGNGSATDTANRGFIWDASAQEFATIAANTEDGTTAGNVTINDYVNLHVGALTSDDRSTLTGGLTIADGGQIGSASDADAIAIGSDGDVTLTQDLELQHDGAILSFGANDEVTLTHVHDTGLLLNGAMALQFNDASQSINAPNATTLDINATAEIELNATLLDVNANINASGTYIGAGLMTTGGNIVIPDAGYIGSVSDTDAIQIEADGDIVMSQDLQVVGTLDVNSSADIAGDLTLSAGADGALRFSAASSVKIKDNEGASLVFEEADAAYMTFVTTDSSEAVKFDKALDINAAVQVDATFTSGVDGQGYDTIFYGDTASANMTWDTSADDLIFNGGAGLIVPEGQLTLGSTAITSTASELNKLDGATVVVAEINYLDLGTTAIGTAVASKAVVLDSSKDYTGIRNLTVSGELDAATGDFSGAVDIAGDLTLSAGADGALTFGAASSVKVIDNNGAALVFEEADNAYMTFVTTDSSEAVKFDKALDINAAVQIDAAFTSGVDGQGYDTKFFGDTSGAYLMWDTSGDKLLTAGGANIDIVKDKLLIGGVAVTTTAAELNILDTVTAVAGELNALDLGSTAVGTAIASKAVILDSNKDYTGIRNLTISGELDAATLDISSSIDVAGNSVLASVDVTGLATAATFEPDGDTAAGDNAAIGYTDAEGLILTGQGTTNDVTIKNDADADVIEIPTGTTNVTIAGTLGTGGAITSGAGLLIADAGTIGSASDTNAIAISSAGLVSLSATNALKLNAGTTAQRPTGAAGHIRYNSTLSQFEGYGSAWGSLGGGATGGGSDTVFVENADDVTTNYTITSGKNAMSVGPITVEAGVVVTIPSGSRWVVL